MRIALTYDLRDEYLAAGFGDEETAEFDRVDTIDSIEGALRGLGHETERVGHLRALMCRLLDGARWDLVFNTAEGVRGFGRESEVPALLEAFAVPYTFSAPPVCALTLHKGMAKRVLRDLGIPTTEFAVVVDERDLSRLELPFPLFVKPVAEGTAMGIDGGSRVETRAELVRRCRKVLASFRQPARVERFLTGRALAAYSHSPRTLPPARARAALPARSRVHGGDRRDVRRLPRGEHARGDARRRRRAALLHLPEQGALRGAVPLRARPGDGRRALRAPRARGLARARRARRRPHRPARGCGGPPPCARDQPAAGAPPDPLRPPHDLERGRPGVPGSDRGDRRIRGGSRGTALPR